MLLSLLSLLALDYTRLHQEHSFCKPLSITLKRSKSLRENETNEVFLIFNRLPYGYTDKKIVSMTTKRGVQDIVVFHS